MGLGWPGLDGSVCRDRDPSPNGGLPSHCGPHPRYGSDLFLSRVLIPDARRSTPNPDHTAGALVRPYMPPLPRVPVGDLLAAPPSAAFTASAMATASATAMTSTTTSTSAGEFDEPRDRVRLWCALYG